MSFEWQLVSTLVPIMLFQVFFLNVRSTTHTDVQLKKQCMSNYITEPLVIWALTDNGPSCYTSAAAAAAAATPCGRQLVLQPKTPHSNAGTKVYTVAVAQHPTATRWNQCMKDGCRRLRCAGAGRGWHARARRPQGANHGPLVHLDAMEINVAFVCTCSFLCHV